MVIGMSLAIPAADAETAHLRGLTVHVDNHADISPARLADVYRDVSRVYRAIGVTIRWADNRSEGTDSMPFVRVLLLSRAMANRKIAAEGVHESVLGEASKETGRIYIYWDRLQTLASRYGRKADEILAIVVAHEIAHLLLPSNSHSSSGIMQAGLDVRTAIALRFTDDQGQVIRQALSADDMPQAAR
jgi:hypothetical protein